MSNEKDKERVEKEEEGSNKTTKSKKKQKEITDFEVMQDFYNRRFPS